MTNAEFKKGLEERTLAFSIRLLDYLDKLPDRNVFRLVVDQLGRSGTSVGANYREANRAESKADFVHKIGVVEKESSETVYWLTVFSRLKALPASFADEHAGLLQEASELLSIFSTVNRSAKRSKLEDVRT
jgi:four helix bundle protein